MKRFCYGQVQAQQPCGPSQERAGVTTRHQTSTVCGRLYIQVHEPLLGERWGCETELLSDFTTTA